MNPEPVMPGAWVCDKCGFLLQKNILHAQDGNISADVADHCEPCPNDGSAMRGFTWREANESLMQMAIQARDSLLTRAADLMRKVDLLETQRAQEQSDIVDLLQLVAATSKQILEGTDFNFEFRRELWKLQTKANAMLVRLTNKEAVQTIFGKDNQAV